MRTVAAMESEMKFSR